MNDDQATLRYINMSYSWRVEDNGKIVADAEYVLLVPSDMTVFDTPTSIKVKGMTLSPDLVGYGEYEITIRRVPPILSPPPPAHSAAQD